MSRVLIVDDNEDNLFLFQEYLEDNDFDVLLARSGPEALATLGERYSQVDAIVLDIQMPGMDGFEVCRRLKEDPQTKDIPVLFITAKFQDVDSVATGLYLGANDYLYKPVEEKELVDRIALIVGPASPRASSVDPLTSLPSRDRIYQDLDEALDRARKAAKPLSAVLLAVTNLDGSSAPTDSDAAITRIARMLSAKIRQKDIVGRWNARQFLLILPGSHEQTALNTAERFRSEIVASHKDQPWEPDILVAVAATNGGDTTLVTERFLEELDQSLAGAS